MMALKLLVAVIAHSGWSSIIYTFLLQPVIDLIIRIQSNSSEDMRIAGTSILIRIESYR
jgi:hypothetical protein